MDETTTQTQDEPQDVQVTQDQPVQEVESTETTPVESESAVEQEPVVEETTNVGEVEEDDEIFVPNIPPVPTLDVSSMVNEENLVDPNVLSQQFNQALQQTADAAAARVRAEMQEQRKEERLWDKAVEQYPELKTNKSLRDMVQNARYGEAVQALNQGKEPTFKTPSQMAKEIFDQIGQARSEGAKQATRNTQVQESAYVESAGTKSDVTQTRVQELRSNIANPNQEVAKQAQIELLKIGLFGEEQ